LKNLLNNAILFCTEILTTHRLLIEVSSISQETQKYNVNTLINLPSRRWTVPNFVPLC